MSKAKVWLPLYVADYLGDTGHLRLHEHGAYLLMLMHYWRNGPLPDDDRFLSGLARMTPEQWAESGVTIRAFFQVRDGKLHQKRMDEEIAEAQANSATKRDAANKRWEGKRRPDGPGGGGKKGTKREPDGDASAMHMHNHPQCPSPSPKEEESKGESLVPSTSREPLAEANEEQQPPAVTPPSSSRVVVPFAPPTSNALYRGGWRWTPPSGAKESSGPTEEEAACLTAWNDLASRVPNLLPAKGCDVLRLRKLRAALELLEGKKGWLDALQRVEASPLWRGETGDVEGWRPGVNDLLKTSTLLGLIEGTHDGKIRRRKPRGGPKHNPVQDILDKHFPQPSDDDESGPILDMEIAI